MSLIFGLDYHIARVPVDEIASCLTAAPKEIVVGGQVPVPR